MELHTGKTSILIITGIKKQVTHVPEVPPLHSLLVTLPPRAITILMSDSIVWPVFDVIPHYCI